MNLDLTRTENFSAMVFTGEFGIVYKAHLVNQKRQIGLGTGWKSKAVAVKFLKGA